MSYRYLTAAIGVPLVLFLVWAGGWLFFAAVTLLALLSLRELQVACRNANTPLVAVVAYPALAALLWVAWHYARAGERSHAGAPYLWLLPVVLLVFGVFCYRPQGKISLASIALTHLATVYVGLFSFLILLRFFPVGDGALMWIVLFGVWTSDTAAYFAGRKWGRRSLTPLSPGKTNEGGAAGFLATILVCGVLARYFEFSLGHALLMGVLVALAAPLGDLIESFWKRELNTKDFGGILPGHGGVLDRCDSLLLTSFVLYLYALWQL